MPSPVFLFLSRLIAKTLSRSLLVVTLALMSLAKIALQPLWMRLPFLSVMVNSGIVPSLKAQIFLDVGEDGVPSHRHVSPCSFPGNHPG